MRRPPAEDRARASGFLIGRGGEESLMKSPHDLARALAAKLWP